MRNTHTKFPPILNHETSSLRRKFLTEQTQRIVSLEAVENDFLVLLALQVLNDPRTDTVV